MSEDRSRPFQFTGGMKELLFLFFPLLGVAFSNYFYLLVEKLFLARLSIQSMEAALAAAYAVQVFQGPCLVLAMMCQVHVGRWRGGVENKKIGPGIWQFIWFSLFSMPVVIFFGMIYGNYYFSGTEIESLVFPYYEMLLWMNFLFPLGAALSCFYLGQGKTRLVFLTTLGAQVIKILLAYPLIFGYGFFPGFGLLGGAISTLISQGGLCLILLVVFLKKQNAEDFLSRSFHFQPQLFWECIHPGLLRGLSRILIMMSWVSISRLMTAKGGDYLFVLSLGGALFVFLPFLGDAICQAETTVVSNLLGSDKAHLLNRALFSCGLLVIATVLLTAIPLVFFSSLTFQLLFPQVNVEGMSIVKIFLGVWISFAFFTFGYLPISVILAYKDMAFSLFMGIANWINGYLLMYFFIEKMKIGADQFWLALSLMHGSTALIYFFRMRWLQRAKTNSLVERGGGGI